MFKKLFIASLFAASSTQLVYAENTSFKQAYSDYNLAIEQQDYSAAVKHAQQALDLGKQIYGEHSENTINLEYNLGLAYSLNKQIELAFNSLDSVANQFSELFGEYSEQRFRALLDQIGTAEYYTQMNFEKQRVKYRFVINAAIDIADNFSDNDKQAKAGTYYLLSKMLIKSPVNSFHFKHAFKTLEKTESLLLATVGEKDSRTVEVQFLLAKYNSAKHRTQSAIKYYETVVTVISDELETSHPYELASRAALVDLYERSGKSEQATEHCIAIGHMTPWNNELDPTPLFRQPPDYPMSKARQGKDGTVVLSFDIDESGFVKNINMLEQSGGIAFVGKAIEALEKWRYAPQIVNGKAVLTEHMKVQLDFKLQRS